jgi:hypothetical protein
VEAYSLPALTFGNNDLKDSDDLQTEPIENGVDYSLLPLLPLTLTVTIDIQTPDLQTEMEFMIHCYH